MRPARGRTGFSKYVVIPPRTRQILSTSRAVEGEIFASLSYLSEIPEVGKEFIAARNPTDPAPERTYGLFRAFIRQAKTFWDAAIPLHHRAGPLNFYYCFLNLVKAYICLSDPVAVSGRVMHGLSSGEPAAVLSETAVRVQPGVYPLFYRACFGVSWPEDLSINILSALGYCGDVTHEYISAGFGESRRLLGTCRIEIHGGESFATLALSQYQILDRFPETKAKIEGTFDLVDLPKQLSEREFGLLVEEATRFTFLETRNTFKIVDDAIPRPAICAECFEALKHHYLFIPYELDRLEFSVYPPYSEQPYAPFHEVLGIYVVMYYLSTLVRYHPAYLERMLESKDSWLIENFALTAPRTFLRHMVNLILDEERVYKSL